MSSRRSGARSGSSTRSATRRFLAGARPGRDGTTCASEVAPNDRRRHSQSTAAGRARGEDGRLHGPARIDRWAARVTRPDPPHEARDGANGRAAVCVLREHRGGRADSARLCIEGPVLRIPEDGDLRAGARVDQTQRSPSQAGHAQHGHVVVGVERDGLGGQGASSGRRDHRVALTGDHVRRGDDDARPGDPPAPLDSCAARSTQHAHDARRSTTGAWLPEHSRIGRLRRQRRPDHRRKRIEPGEQVEESPRRDDRVQLPDDDRTLEVPSNLRATREVQADGSQHPDHRQPRYRPEEQASDQVQRSKRRRPEAPADGGPESATDSLEQDGRADGAGESDQRCVRRVSFAGEDVRRHVLAAEKSSADETRKREAAPQASPCEAPPSAATATIPTATQSTQVTPELG